MINFDIQKRVVFCPIWIVLLQSLSSSFAYVHAQEIHLNAKSISLVKGIDAQPLLAQVKRVSQALDYLGSPLPAEIKAELRRAAEMENETDQVIAIQRAIDPYCLVAIHINPEARVKATRGPAKPELDEQGWRIFLVKVLNDAGVTAPLRIYSPNAEALHNSAKSELSDRWLDLQMFDRRPLQPTLSGLKAEYRILQLYSRDSGKREAKLTFDVGQGTQDLGFRSDVDILFHCIETAPVTLRILDENGNPATANFVIRDKQGRVYPSQAKRLAPDFFFQPQIYRADGERVKLPPGEYKFECRRGPETLPEKRQVTLSGKPETITFSLKRWVDPSKLGWWSGDHHIHAAGCLHYENPTQGVSPKVVALHCQGEDVKVGCALTWGPCFDFQKQFYTGERDVDEVSQYPYLLRYDIEVSGFGSHQSGHLVLLGLKEQNYPGGESTNHWPTLGLNILKWAKKQGAVVGYAHSGFGLEVGTAELPNYIIPPFDGIGANEYIVDVTHKVPGPDGNLVPVVDLFTTVNTPYFTELNIWYHTLNCGFRARLSGETDWPCNDGQRIGRGRVYVRVDGPLSFKAWSKGIWNGRTYVSSGTSHLMDFQVNHVGVGENDSELRLKEPATVRVIAKVAALLSEKVQPKRVAPKFPSLKLAENTGDWEDIFWKLERARIGNSRNVTVEVVVNGYPAAKKVIVADGKTRDVSFDIEIERSSWVALRILGASHTSPVFVLVGDKPIRASRRSAEWCLKGVNQCWSQKKRFIHADEMREAKEAYDHARRTYQRILEECEVD